MKSIYLCSGQFGAFIIKKHSNSNLIDSIYNKEIDENDFYQIFENHKSLPVLISSEIDKGGLVHKRYYQQFRGIEVVDSEVIVHYNKNNQITFIQGQILDTEGFLFEPRLSKDDVRNEIFSIYSEYSAISIQDVELVITNSNLAYKVNISYLNDFSLNLGGQKYINKTVYLDANNAEVIKEKIYNSDLALQEVTFQNPASVYGNIMPTETPGVSGSVSIPALVEYQAYYDDELSGGGELIVDQESYKNVLKNNYSLYRKWDVRIADTSSKTYYNYSEYVNNGDTICLDQSDVSLPSAYSAANNISLIQKYNYYQLGRKSFDNGNLVENGAAAVLFIDHGLFEGNCGFISNSISTSGSNYTPFTFYFGTAGEDNDSSMCVLDFVAHEYAHGITYFSSGLETDVISTDPNYEKEMEEAALCESYSDIFACVVEHYYQSDDNNNYSTYFSDDSNPAPGKFDWLIGEDCYSQNPKAARDMRNPTNEYVKNGLTASKYYKSNRYLNNTNCHDRAGIQNFAFYLLSSGGSGINDDSPTDIAYNVEGIGIELAGQIALTANIHFMSGRYGASFLDSRTAWSWAAYSMSNYNYTPELQAVLESIYNAWHAVGVN